MDIIEVFERFPAQQSCIKHLERARWPNGPTCPYCQSAQSTPLPKQRRHHCNTCNTTYSVTVRTIFNHTHLPLQKWFLAVSIILNAKKGVSAHQLARHLHVHRNTAWRISMQIRKAMAERHQREILRGIVEMDETYVGGKPRKNSDRSPKGTNKRGRGTKKTPVVGMAERGGKVKAKAFHKKRLGFQQLSQLVREHIDRSNTTLMTDEWSSYRSMSLLLPHRTINHKVAYADGDIHTNTIESFWALLKRGIVGQFHKVSVKHLPKYLDEFSYRFNNRKNENVFYDTLAKGVAIA